MLLSEHVVKSLGRSTGFVFDECEVLLDIVMRTKQIDNNVTCTVHTSLKLLKLCCGSAK